MKGFLAALIIVALPTAAFAQDLDPVEQQRLKDWRSATQKAGLASIGIAVGLGIPLAANKPTLFSDGLCKAGDPMFGSFGCDGGLAIVHFVFAGSALALFVASELIAMEMSPTPYETGNTTRDNASKAFLWTNVGLFSVQPLLGLLAAHPGPAVARRETHGVEGRAGARRGLGPGPRGAVRPPQPASRI